MFHICLMCEAVFGAQRAGSLYLCLACQERYERLYKPTTLGGAEHSVEILTLHEYRGWIRRLLLRAKVASDHRAMLGLLDFVLSSREARRLIDWADYIVPAPSSLWGRLKGRLDIAHFLSSRLGADFGKPVLVLPFRHYSRIKKRAFIRGRSWYSDSFSKRPAQAEVPSAGDFEASTRPFEADADEAGRIVLIDDIVTSGVTMMRIASEFQGLAVKGLTLACAGSLD